MCDVHQYVFSRIASFDVGIKHLSICQIDMNKYKNSFTIVKWCMLNLRGKNISDYTNSIIEKLREVEWGFLDYVLIEQQVSRNTQMKVLSHVIQTYFVCERRLRSDCVKFVSPKIKFSTSNPEYNELVKECEGLLRNKNCDNEGKYSLKKLSVLITKSLLQKNGDEKWYSHLSEFKKADDMADSFLQAFAWGVDTKSHMEVD